MRLCRTLGLLLLLVFEISAQETGKTAHIVRASGDATVKAKPDQAQITVGVVTHAETAQSAAAQNATQTAAVLERLKQTLGEKGRVQTTGYSISPDYEYPRDGGTPKVTGYSASNSVVATIDDLSLVGTVIDSATSAGANDINGIAFTLRDDSAARAEALGAAAARARASAEAIAKALNLQVVGIAQAWSEDATPIRPVLGEVRPFNKANTQVPTPVEPGTLDIHARVVVSLEVK